MSPTVAERPRQLLKNNKLALVVGQIRFPKLPRFTEEPYTVGFQEAMRQSYPKATTGESMDLLLTANGVQKQDGAKQLRFTSMDDRFSVVLTAELVTLECRKYDIDIDEFSERFAWVAAQAKASFDLRHQVRIGLRYINEFRDPRRKTYADWRMCFTSQYVGWDPQSLGGDVMNTIAEFTLRRPEPDGGTFILRRGFLIGTTVLPLKVAPPIEPAEFYLFDMDYFDDAPQAYEADPRERFKRYERFMKEDVFDKALTAETLDWIKGGAS